jgi:microcystin-dependent protein
MSVPYLSEIRIMSFGFPPKGWAQCNGQLLPINQNQALFSLLGTTYGGDGRTTFGLPNLQARTAIHGKGGQGLGQLGGEAAHTLVAGDAPIPAGNYLGAADNLYAPLAHITPLPAATVANAGGQPHNNMQPYLVLNFCIALQGIYPSRN